MALLLLAILLYYTQVNEIFLSGKAMLAAAFFLTGYGVRQLQLKEWIKGLIFVLGLAIILFCAKYMPIAFGGLYDWKYVFYVYLMGVIGSWMLMIGAYWLAKCLPNAIKRPLFFAGENTIVILGLHFLCFKLVDAVKVWYYDMPWTTIQEFPFVSQIPNGHGAFGVWWLAYIVVGFCVPLLLLWGYQKVKHSLTR